MSKKKLFFIIIAVIAVLFGLYLFNNFRRWEISDKKTNLEIDKRMGSYDNIESIDVNKIYGSLYQSWGGYELGKKIDYLKSVNELSKSSFLSSFIWDYSGAINDREKFCVSKDQNQDFCSKKQMDLKLWDITDMSWKILSDVGVSLDWVYLWNIKNIKKVDGYNNFVHRVKFSKKGYLDFYSKIVLWNSPYIDIEESPKLLKSDYFKTIKTDENFTYKTKNFTYNIIADAFLKNDWTQASWNIDVYFFDIWANNWDLNALNLDIFDDNYSYLGSSFTTLWMPLIKAYSWDEELNIISGKVSWTWIIQNRERAPWMDLNGVPKNVWLTKYELDMYKIPPFWFLDQKNWVWKSGKMKILDPLWNYEFNL